MSEQTQQPENVKPALSPADIAGALRKNPEAVVKLVVLISEIHLRLGQHQRLIAAVNRAAKSAGKEWAEANTAVQQLNAAGPDDLDALASFEIRHCATQGDGFLTALLAAEENLSQAADRVFETQAEAHRAHRAAEAVSDEAERFEVVLRALGLGKLVAAARQPVAPPVAAKPEVEATSAQPRRQVVVPEPRPADSDYRRGRHVKLLQAWKGKGIVVTSDRDPDEAAVVLAPVEGQPGRWLVLAGYDQVPIGQAVGLAALIAGLGPATLFRFGQKLGVPAEQVRACLAETRTAKQTADRAARVERDRGPLGARSLADQVRSLRIVPIAPTPAPAE